jgi:hypothetical protein
MNIKRTSISGYIVAVEAYLKRMGFNKVVSQVGNW